MDPKTLTRPNRAGFAQRLLIAAVALGLLLAGAATARKHMPSQGLWKLVTLQLFTSTTATSASATLAHDGTDVTLSDSLEITGDLLFEADATRDVGAETARAASVFSVNQNFEVPPALISVAGPTTIGTWLTRADGGSANVVLTLPDATGTDVKGRVYRVCWGDTTTNDVDVVSAGGTVGLPDQAASGVAAGTGVTPSADDGCAEWQSDGTNWLFAGGDAVASN